ncbi:hypothetical protein EC957_011215 [Mortierella hygrophila]|uniref:Uncharacterized protein n=1 Tax=Mortierella hygrophila TaxID=979708 RepID=A0A9P6F9G6_9FUNG|nr:hypothetical protein EC957_011215 [Mortierella hygrophila]
MPKRKPLRVGNMHGELGSFKPGVKTLFCRSLEQDGRGRYFPIAARNISEWNWSPTSLQEILGPTHKETRYGFYGFKNRAHKEIDYPRQAQEQDQGGQVITRAVTRAAISTFEQHTCLALLPRYLQVLQDHDVHYLARQLIRDRHELQKPYDLNDPLPEMLQRQDKVLQILLHLNPPLDRKGPSENDALLVWAHVFGLARSNDHIITLQTGEQTLEASKILRQQQAAEFDDVSDPGRKGIEISNIEIKEPGSGAMDITVQSRKNVQLGRCLQELHRKYGEQELSVIMGYMAADHDRGSVGGGTTSPSAVHLPTSQVEFEMFLKCTSLAQIFNYVEYLEHMAPKFKRQQEMYDLEKKIEFFVQAIAGPRPTTPPPKRKAFGQNVTF